MIQKSRLYHWPNILSLDAALIALAWLWAFSRATGSNPSAAPYLVLGLSTWLTYLADRLFDVRHRNVEQLHAQRHRFAKFHYRKLWAIWSTILISNVTIAWSSLSLDQLQNGFRLLTICLIYTGLNQRLSRRFFPKELCVAVIYTGGVLAFLDTSPSNLSALSFAMLCLINCLMIGIKERRVDAALRVKSLAFYLQPSMLWILLALTAGSTAFIEPILAWSIGSTLVLLAGLQLRQQQFSVETFRVLTDAALLSGVFMGPIL